MFQSNFKNKLKCIFNQVTVMELIRFMTAVSKFIYFLLNKKKEITPSGGEELSLSIFPIIQKYKINTLLNNFYNKQILITIK